MTYIRFGGKVTGEDGGHGAFVLGEGSDELG